MVETKSVHFSPILQQTFDGSLLASSEIDAIPEEMDFEKAYIVSLSKSAKKYRVPADDSDEPRRPRRRKVALVSIGFILLLGVGGLLIYFITRELSKREEHTYNGNVGDKENGFSAETTALQENTSRSPPATRTRKLSWWVRPSAFSPDQTHLKTTMKVYMSSGLATEIVPGKHITSSTAIASTNSVSRSAAPHSLPRQESTILLKKSEKTIFFGTHFSRFFKPTSGLSTGLISQNVYGGLSSPASVHKITASFDNSRGKMFNSTVTVSPQSIATTGESTNKLLMISSSEKTWPHAGTVTKELQRTSILTSSRDSGKSQKTTKQIGQSQSRLITFTSATKSKSQLSLSIAKGSEAKIRSAGARHLCSTVVVNATAERLKGNYLNRSEVMMTFSLAPSTNYVVKNSSEENLSSNLPTSIFSQSQWLTQFQQSSLLQRSRVRSVLSTAKPLKTSIPGSSTSMFSCSQSALSTPLLSSLILTSAMKSVLRTEKLSSSSSQELSNIEVATFPSLLNTLKETFRTIKEIRATEHTVVTSATVSPLLHATSSNAVTVAWQSDSYGKKSFVEQLKVSSFNTLTPSSYFTSENASTIKDRVLTKTPRKSFTPLLSTRQPPFSSKLNTKPGFHTHTIVPKPTIPSKSMVSLFANLVPSLVSKVFYHSNYQPTTTLTPHATFSYSYLYRNGVTLSISTIFLNYGKFESPGTVIPNAASSNSGRTSAYLRQRQSSEATLQAVAPSSRLTKDFEGTGIPPSASSLAHLKTTKSFKESRLHHQTLSFNLATKLKTSLTYTSREGSRDTPAPSSFKTIFIRGSSIDTPSPSRSKSIIIRGSSRDSPAPSSSKIIIITIAISSSARFVTLSNTKSRKTTSQLVTNEPLSLNSSFLHLNSKGGVKENQSTYHMALVYNTSFHYTLRVNHVSGNLNSTLFSITRFPSVVISTRLSTVVLSTPFNNSLRRSNKLSQNGSLPTHSLQSTVNSSAIGTLASKSRSIVHVTYAGNTKIWYPSSSAQTTINRAVTSNSSTPFKIMDGSLIIRDKTYHTNLSNPNTTMFKTLADEVETSIMDIISLNNTELLGVKVTSFRNGSVVADFSLTVRYDSPFSDQEFAYLLSEANGTLWRGYHVTNITVALRTVEEGSPERSLGQDDAELSMSAIIVMLSVLVVLLITVGGFGVYFCKKKGLCPKSRVKPVDSPIPPSEQEKIQTVHRDHAWVTKDEPFLNTDVTADAHNRNGSFLESLSMRVLEGKDTQPEENDNRGGDKLPDSTKNLFEADNDNADAADDQTLNRGVTPLTSGSNLPKHSVEQSVGPQLKSN